MAKPYFRQVPNFEYISREPNAENISDYTAVKNLFKRGKFREDIFKNLKFFTKYNIIGDERPDNVAYKLYNDSTLDWVVLLSNNILNVQNEWPMTQATFDQVMLEKYGSYENLYSGIHHYETNEIKDSSGRIILKSGLTISQTWKNNGNFTQLLKSNISVISSGNSVNSNAIVRVFMNDGIPNLNVGDQIIVDNVSGEYNGAHVITEILSYYQDNIEDPIYVDAFKFELPYVPNIASPTISSSASILVRITDDSVLTPNSYYYEYWDDSLGYSVYTPSTDLLVPVTNYEYELRTEDKKRNIFTLKPQYLNVVFNDLDDFMPYKKGSTQYVNATLKRGDNIRLYE